MIKYKNELVNSEITSKLYSKLKSIWDFDDWALGILFELKTDSERIAILDMIESGETNANRIALKALEFRGLVGTPYEEFDGNPEDIINLDEDE